MKDNKQNRHNRYSKRDGNEQRPAHGSEQKEVRAIVTSPFDEQLSPQERLESCIALSELVAKMVTHVICHTIVDYQEQLRDERLSVASAFLQRMTSTHLCNHKLTKEGIVCSYGGQTFRLHEEFKTMTLTRSVYEHLVMFYFLFIHPKSDEERSVVWEYWKSNGQKNGCVACYRQQGKIDVRRVSYSQAWKYLFEQEDMAQLYCHLSMHCHPVYDGLMQYQRQTQNDEGYDGIPLYLSCCFLVYLCRAYLRLLPNGNKMLRQAFSKREMQVFDALSHLPNEEKKELE